MQNIIDTITSGDLQKILELLFKGGVILFCIYFAIYLLFQVRQIRVLQMKVKTSTDTLMNLFSFVYLGLQFTLIIIVIIVIL